MVLAVGVSTAIARTDTLLEQPATRRRRSDSCQVIGSAWRGSRPQRADGTEGSLDARHRSRTIPVGASGFGDDSAEERERLSCRFVPGWSAPVYLVVSGSLVSGQRTRLGLSCGDFGKYT